MGFKKFLERFYRSVEVEGMDVKVYINPNAKEFHALTKKYPAWRGILADNDVYIWKDWDATHHQMIKSLNFGDDVILFVMDNGDLDSAWYYSKYDADLTEYDLVRYPNFRRMIGP